MALLSYGLRTLKLSMVFRGIVAFLVLQSFHFKKFLRFFFMLCSVGGSVNKLSYLSLRLSPWLSQEVDRMEPLIGAERRKGVCAGQDAGGKRRVYG